MGAERRLPPPGASWAHLWVLVWTAIDDFGGLGPQGLDIVKVKAHTTEKHVQDGVIRAKHRRGNHEADSWVKL